MPRITVRVDEDTEEWLEQEAERLDWSKAKTGGRCIELLQAEAGHITPQHPDADRDINLMQSDAADVGDLQTHLDELEERMETLEESARHREERLSALESRDVSHDSGRETGAQADDESPTPPPDAHSAAHSASQVTPDAGESPEEERGRAGVAVKVDSLRAKAEEAAQDAEVPGRSAGVERVRREALLWAWDYLREHEHCRSSEIANATFGAFWDEARLSYSVSPRYPGYGMWDGYLRDALAELPGVEAPGRRGKDWFFEERE